MKTQQNVRLAVTAVALAFVGSLWAGTPHTQQQAPPIKLGTSGSNVGDINPSFCCTGTLGSQVKDSNGVKYILSNNHVLALANTGTVGQAIMQRGYVDTVPVCSTAGTITVANLTRFVTINFAGGNNVADAAIAQVVPGQVSPNGAILEIGTVSATPVAPAVGVVERSHADHRHLERQLDQRAPAQRAGLVAPGQARYRAVAGDQVPGRGLPDRGRG